MSQGDEPCIVIGRGFRLTPSMNRIKDNYQLFLAPFGSFAELLEVGVGVVHPGLQHGARLAPHRGVLHRQAHARQARQQPPRERLPRAQPALVQLLHSVPDKLT